MPPIQTSIRCSTCGQPVNAIVRTVIDAAKDPEGKALLLTGQLNVAQCQQCGSVNMIATPILYHDPQKELLVAHVPPEVALKQGGEEKIIGDLLNELTNNLPKGEFKAYMFNPKRALTMQGLVDQVLQADGVTPEMLQAQRGRVEIIQRMIDADEDVLQELIKQNDAKIDRQFFQTITAMAQRFIAGGEGELADRLINVQNFLLQHSSEGNRIQEAQARQNQIVEEVVAEIEGLGESPERQDLIDLVISHVDDPTHIEAIVSLVRPAMDYQFFQEFTENIGKAPAAEREKLEGLRQTLVDLTTAIDQQQQMVFQQAAQFLQAIVGSPNPAELIQANIQLIDDVFMAVLSANIQEAERRKDVAAAARLKEIYNQVVTALQSQMQPELRFVNDLLSIQSDEEIKARIGEEAPQFGPVLLEVIDAVEEVLKSQAQPGVMDRLAMIRAEAAAMLG